MITRYKKRISRRLKSEDISDDDYVPSESELNNSSSSLHRIEEDDIDEDELQELIDDAKKIINAIDKKYNESESESEEDESSEEYEIVNTKKDELDRQYMKLCDRCPKDKQNFTYFKSLDDENKRYILEREQKIQKINYGEVPSRFKVLQLPIDIHLKAQIIRRFDVLDTLEDTSSDYHKINEWISTLLSVPFNIYHELSIDKTSSKVDIHQYLVKTKKILDKSIYGHDHAKFQFLQFITQLITNPDAKGQIIGLQGPMGNGKTTFVKEGICNAIDRPFTSIPLGGASDSSLLEGHSYTYEGSVCGRIVKVLIESKCMNPIIYFDELDKVSECIKGRELIHKLIHLTDHSQNTEFTDQYFSGIKFDMSRALFIFSFNDGTKINPILKDRMRVIKMPELKLKQKLVIASDYLIPSLCKEIGFDRSKIEISNEVIEYMISRNPKEKGVRTLKRCIETILSKLNMLQFIVDDKEMDVPFMLKEVTYPFQITRQVVNKLIDRESDKPNNMMYI